MNLAPVSRFMRFYGPPILVITLGRRKDGSLDGRQDKRILIKVIGE